MLCLAGVALLRSHAHITTHLRVYGGLSLRDREPPWMRDNGVLHRSKMTSSLDIALKEGRPGQDEDSEGDARELDQERPNE